MICYNCKAEIEDGSNFCEKCGMSQLFSEELIEKAIQGEEEAVNQLFHRTYNSVYLTIISIIKDEYIAEDILQETYLKAFRSLKQLQDASKFQSWVKKIATNKSIDQFRKMQKESAQSINFSTMETEEQDVVDFKDERVDRLPEVVIDQNETKRLVTEILNSLPDEQRIVVALHYHEQMSVKEIADELDVSENTVKSRLNYGRKKIETQVKELEKKGTKLYGLAPLPFLALLFKNQEVYAAELPSFEVMHAIEKECIKAPSAMNKTITRKSTPNISNREQSQNAALNNAYTKAGANTVKTVAGTAGKGIITKVIAGIVAVAVIGGATAGALAYKNSQEEEPVAKEEVQEEPKEKESETTKKEPVQFDGIYICDDTAIIIYINAEGDGQTSIIMDNYLQNGSSAWGIRGMGTIDNNTIKMIPDGYEEQSVDLTKNEDGTLTVQFSTEPYTNTKASGTYYITENDDYGDLMNKYLSTHEVEGYNADTDTETNINLENYNDYSYYDETGMLKYKINYEYDENFGNPIYRFYLTGWFNRGRYDEYDEILYMVDLSEPNGNIYTATNVYDTGKSYMYQFQSLTFTFNEDNVVMDVKRNEDTVAGGEGNSIQTGSYVLKKN